MEVFTTGGYMIGLIITKKCKPVSRVLLLTFQSASYHLSSPDFAIGVNQPTRPDFHKWMSRAAHVRDLFGLSTRKVCRALRVATKAVSSYLTFSPFPHSTSRTE